MPARIRTRGKSGAAVLKLKFEKGFRGRSEPLHSLRKHKSRSENGVTPLSLAVVIHIGKVRAIFSPLGLPVSDPDRARRNSDDSKGIAG